MTAYMHTAANYFTNMNWMGLLSLLVNAAAALTCITFHELAHGVAACRLGDPTAKNAGRLSLNPLKHLDIIGFLMMIFVGVGWAKPVPVDMRYFRSPKRGMALTALAGPASNFIMAAVTTFSCSLYYRYLLPTNSIPLLILFAFLCNVAILNVGLGLFNLIPITPLDGSKVLFAFLPDRMYYTILRYERYVMLAVIALTFLNVFDRPLSYCINGVLNFFCRMTGLPWDALVVGSQILELMG